MPLGRGVFHVNYVNTLKILISLYGFKKYVFWNNRFIEINNDFKHLIKGLNHD